MGTKPNNIQQQAADQSLISGLTKHEQSLSSFLVGSTSFKTSDIITALQARIAAANTAQSTRATWLTAVKANANERASTKALVSGVRQQVQVMFAGSVDTLADFGLKPRKVRAAPTPEEKVAAAAKAKATRAARHTMGSKQKKGVKGTVTTIVASTSPTASPPAAPSPVASAPAQGTTTAGTPPHTP
jgi:hypothetical protein